MPHASFSQSEEIMQPDDIITHFGHNLEFTNYTQCFHYSTHSLLIIHVADVQLAGR